MRGMENTKCKNKSIPSPTNDKFLQNMMRSVDALPAKSEANLESVNGRSHEASSPPKIAPTNFAHKFFKLEFDGTFVEMTKLS